MQAAAAGPPEAVEGGADHVEEEVACRMLADIKHINANPAVHETDSAGTDALVHSSFFLSSPHLAKH